MTYKRLSIPRDKVYRYDYTLHLSHILAQRWIYSCMPASMEPLTRKEEGVAAACNERHSSWPMNKTLRGSCNVSIASQPSDGQIVVRVLWKNPCGPEAFILYKWPTKLVKKITQYVINFTRTTSNCTKTLSDKICQTTQTSFLFREQIYHSKKKPSWERYIQMCSYIFRAAQSVSRKSQSCSWRLGCTSVYQAFLFKKKHLLCLTYWATQYL